MSESVKGKEKFSVIISEISSKIPAEGITSEDFLDITGGRGLFMSCMILTAPFLLPVDIPGSSIPFGSAIFLISSGIIFNRPVLIPKRFMGYKISKKDMQSFLNGISRILTPLEKKIIAPRLCFLTRGRRMEFINGVAVAFGAVLLVTPIIAPLGDFFPAYGILFISLGNLENDGLLVLAGYVIVIATAIYYALIYAVTILVIISIISYLGHL
ncbi:MAG: exopolysaccharide biosynthesis protein [Methanobacterium sp.]